MDISNLGTVGAAVLTALSVAAGVFYKRGQDRRDAADAKQAKADELAAQKAQAIFDQMSEALEGNRAELRSAQKDIQTLRRDSEELWSKMGAMRRTLNAYEAHIADWNRWADAGSQGPRPVPLVGTVQ